MVQLSNCITITNPEKVLLFKKMVKSAAEVDDYVIAFRENTKISKETVRFTLLLIFLFLLLFLFLFLFFFTLKSSS